MSEKKQKPDRERFSPCPPRRARAAKRQISPRARAHKIPAQPSGSLNETAVRAGIFYIISQLFVRGISFLMTPFYTRLLSNAQYSQVKVYESWLLIFLPVMSLCLWRSVERAKYDVREKFNEFVSSVQTLSYLSITGFLLLALLLRRQVLQFCSMTDFTLCIAFLYTYAHTSIYYFQRREKQMMRYRASTAFTALTVIPATLCSVLLLLWGRANGLEERLVDLRIGGYYIPMILGGFFAGFLLLAQGKKLVHPGYWKYALRFSLPLIPEVLSIQIMNQADRLMVSKMTGDLHGSIFSLATTVSYIIWILEDSVWNAWLPWMYEKLSRREPEDICRCWSVLMHGFGLISWILVLLAPEIVRILGGRSYADSAFLIAPMVSGTLFRFYSYSYTAIQNYYKKTGFVAVSTTAVMLLNVVLNYIFILLAGYQAAAYTTAFSYLVLMCVQAHLERRLTGTQLIPLRRTLLVSMGYFLLCMGSMALFSAPAFCRYVLSALVLLSGGRRFLPQLSVLQKELGHKK